MIPHSAPSLGIEEEQAIARALHSGRLTQGPETAAFEAECAAYLGWRHAVAVNSGTSALHLALLVLGLSGEKVVSPSYACAALLTACGLAKAQPTLADIGGDYNLDPNTAPHDCRGAIVPHLFGAPARIPPDIICIEDIAQRMLPERAESCPLAVTSFYATKMITTGEGGMVLTNDDGIAEAIRDLRDYDKRDAYAQRHNYKMTEMQAAMGRVQLQKLPAFLERRRTLAARYTEAFQKTPLRLPHPPGHAFFRYVAATERRDALEAWLNARGIEAKRPVHAPAHHYLGGAFPMSEQAHQQCLSLPLYPAMTDTAAAAVIREVLNFFDETAPC